MRFLCPNKSLEPTAAAFGFSAAPISSRRFIPLWLSSYPLGGIRMRYTFTALLFGWLLLGCTSTVTSYRVEPDGRVTTGATVTTDEHWKQVVAERIGREMRGEPAEAGDSSWATYWPSWYSNIRRRPEDMVAYIKQQRIAKELPTYE